MEDSERYQRLDHPSYYNVYRQKAPEPLPFDILCSKKGIVRYIDLGQKFGVVNVNMDVYHLIVDWLKKSKISLEGNPINLFDTSSQERTAHSIVLLERLVDDKTYRTFLHQQLMELEPNFSRLRDYLYSCVVGQL